MNEIDNDDFYISPLLELESEWELLTYPEKIICTSYAESLTRNIKPNDNLIKLVNDIHDKYSDFHIGCMP